MARSRLREAVSDILFWSGLVLIGIIAIPTVLLIGIIYVIWELIMLADGKPEE